MAYGTVKVDNITFTNAGVDQTITVSGIVQSISGDITATGTIQAQTIIGTSTVSGATVTGTAGVFTTVTGGSAGFTTVTGTTVTGTTANFITLSGTTVTGNAGQFTTITGTSAGFATLSGTTITGSVGNFGSGSAAAPSVSVGTTNNGIYSPGTDQVAISTNGTGRLFVDASGRVVAGGDGTIGGTAILGAIGSTSGSIYGGTLALVQGRTPPNGSSLGIINFGSETNPAGAAISSTAAEAWTEGSSQGSDLQFLTTNTGSASAIERLRITSDGKLGVGTSAPVFLTDILSGTANTGANVNNPSQLSVTGPSKSLTAGGATVFINSNSDFAIDTGGSIALSGRNTTGSTSSIVWGVIKGAKENATSTNTAGYLAFATQRHSAGALVEAMRIDSSGRLLVGTSTGLSTVFAGSGQLQVVKDGINAAQIFGFSSAGQDYTPCLEIGRGRNTQASPSAALNADWLGSINFYGHDGTQFIPAAYITARADGTTGTNDMPGRLVFSTTADGASSPTERLRITSTGNVGIGTSSPAKTLDVVGQARISSVLTMGSYIQGTTQLDLYGDSSSSSGIRLDSSGRLLVGTTTASGANLLQVNSDALIYGVTVGRGSGAVATNVAVGGEALNANTTGSANSAVGYRALYANTAGSYNIAIGANSLRFNVSGGYNTATGFESLYSNTTGTHNVATGFKALNSNTTGSYNIATGLQALYLNTTGIQNIATGYEALYSNTAGNSNVATGYQALYSNTTGYYNAATGYRALYLNTTGAQNVATGYAALSSNTTGSNNIATGLQALYLNTTGAGNVASGFQALYSNTTADYNVANGYQCLYANTTGSYNIAYGTQALYANTTGSRNTATGMYALLNNTIGTNNTAVGFQTIASNTSGYYNVAVGMNALYANTTGYENVANGNEALHTNSTGAGNVASGYRTLYSNSTGLGNAAYGFQALYSNTTANYNTASGFQSLFFNTTGTYNAAFGAQALYSNTSGSYNVASGPKALFSNTTGANNTATGFESLYSNTTGFNNVAAGYSALRSNTTGSSNVATGVEALYSNTTGATNTAYGNQALFLNTTGSQNTANGTQALRSNTTGNYNTANGYIALYSNTSGSSNTANGNRALYSNTIGYSNVANGNNALYSNTTGFRNVGIGHEALYSHTTGAGNNAVGHQAGYSITTASNNSAFGYQALYSTTTGATNTAIGGQALYANTTGSYNTASGYAALFSNTTGNHNVAISYQALYANTTGANNTAIGSVALYANTTGSANNVIGYDGLRFNTTGNHNNGHGYQALYANTTGNNNVAYGTYGLYANTTGNNNIAIGYTAGSALTTGSNNVIIGGIAGTAGLADTMIFGTGNGTERFRVDSSGNFGIGTSSPNLALHVSSGTAAGINNVAILKGGGSSSGNGAGLVLSPDSANTYNTWLGSRVATAFGGGTWGCHLIFSTNDNSAAGNLTERMRITSDGKLGLGTSSPSELLHLSGGDIAFSSNQNRSLKVLTGGSNVPGGSLTLEAGSAGTGSNGVDAGQIIIKAGNGYDGLGTFQRGDILFYAGANTYGDTYHGSIKFFTASGVGVTSEKVIIDSSGRLLVGTSSAPGGQSANSRLSIVADITAGVTQGDVSILSGASAASTNYNGAPLGILRFGDAVGNPFASIQCVGDAVTSTNDYPGRLVFSTTADGASAPQERMRIGNDGLIVTYGNTNCIIAASAEAAGTTYTTFRGRRSATSTQTGVDTFLVYTNGNVVNTNNSYGAISDIKLKENIIDASSQWDDIKALRPVNYNFKKGQTHTQIGLVAQEVELVSPGLVSESPDRDEDGNDLGTVTKSVNYSVLYMKAVKALQEAMERIETLEAKVAALETP